MVRLHVVFVRRARFTLCSVGIYSFRDRITFLMGETSSLTRI